MPEGLVQAYRNTRFEVRGPLGTFVLYVGQRSPELLALYAAYGVCSAAHLTAFNPGSRRLSDAQNKARQRCMEAQLQARGYPAGEWPSEDSVLALGIDQPAAGAIGREYGQHAIVWCGPEGTARLVMLASP